VGKNHVNVCFGGRSPSVSITKNDNGGFEFRFGSGGFGFGSGGFGFGFGSGEFGYGHDAMFLPYELTFVVDKPRLGFSLIMTTLGLAVTANFVKA